MMFVLGLIFGYLSCTAIVVTSQREKNHNLLRVLAMTLVAAPIFLYCFIKHPGDK